MLSGIVVLQTDFFSSEEVETWGGSSRPPLAIMLVIRLWSPLSICVVDPMGGVEVVRSVGVERGEEVVRSVEVERGVEVVGAARACAMAWPLA